MQTTDHKARLEETIDAIGITKTLEAIAEICNAKAEHVLTNWQDELLASKWELYASRIELVAEQIDL